MQTHDEPIRLDRRRLLQGSAAALAVPAALALAGFPAGRAAAQADTASPASSPAAGVESGYAPVNGLDLYYEIHGTDQGGTPLVLLHGGFTTIDFQFGPLLPGLTQGRQVIGVELQAHGHTADIDRPFSFEAMADDIAALLGYLDLTRVDIFGYSLGGGVALQTAIRHPDSTGKLVLLSTPFRQDGWYPEVLVGMAAVSAAAAEAMQQTPFYPAYVAVAPDPDNWPNLLDKMGQLLSQPYDWTGDVRALTSPVQIIIGDSDSVQPAHALEFFALLGGGVPGDFGPLPASELAILPHTAHSAATLRADLLLPIVTPFLDGAAT